MKKHVVYLGCLALSAALVGGATFGYGATGVKTAADSAQVKVPFADDADFLAQFGAACEEAAANYSEEANVAELARARQSLKNETKSLVYLLNRNSNRKHAEGWIKFLKLQELQRTLMGSSSSEDRAVIDQSLERFHKEEPGLDEEYFIKVRDALERYVELLDAPKGTQDRKAEFAEDCGRLRDAVKEFVENGSAAQSETVSALFAYLNDCQPKSVSLRKASQLLAARFSMTNVQIEAAGRCFLSDHLTEFTQPTTVRETIRGTATQGKGTTTGTVQVELADNPRQAEIRLMVNAQTVTDNVGYNQGVTVYSHSKATLSAAKSIFLTDTLSTEPAKVVSRMDTKITGINSGRGNIGTQVVYDRVYEEFPYSKAESQRLAEYRFAERVNSQVNNGLKRENGFANLMNYLKENDYSPRVLSSSTTKDRIFWSALFGNQTQVGPTSGIKLEGTHDLSIKIHASAPNNVSFFALAGERISDREFSEWFGKIFPGIGKQCASRADKAKAESEKKSDEPAAETTAEPAAGEDASEEGPKTDEPFFMTFSSEMPLITTYENNKATVVARIEQFEQEEKTFPGLNIEVAYEVQQRENDFVLVRSSLDAWPLDLDRSDSIPARFQAIRTQLIKKLETELKPEYKIEPIVVKKNAFGPDASTAASSDPVTQIRGMLAVREFLMKDGWLAVGAEFVPVERK